MKRILIPICALTMCLLTAPAAFAGLDITWDACNQGPGHTSVKTFDCAGGAPAKLFYCFQPPISSTTFFSIDFTTDVKIDDSAILPQLWHWETGGCNANALTISSDKPPTKCPTATHVNLWGTGGNPAGLIRAYSAGFGGANKALIFMTVTRPASDPVAITSGINYFGCILTFNMENASELGGTCAGCSSSATIVWNSATLFTWDSRSGPPTQTPVSGGGLVSDCAAVGPVGGGATNCQATPAYNRTWGALKTLYK